MPNPVRLKQLETASAFCLFDRKLSSSGSSSIVWGVLNLLIGAAILSGQNRWGIVSAALGLALIAAGIYERKVRDPKVIIISAATLGGLAVWNFTLIAMAAMGKAQLALGGRTLYWAIAQAWGAVSTWKTFSTYKMLSAEADSVLVQQIRGHIDELKAAKPSQRLDLIEFEAHAGFVQGTMRYRLMPFEDLYMVAKYKSQLRSLHLEELTFADRNSVTFTPEGEKWMSKKIKGAVQLGPIKIEKATIEPEMAMRLTPGAVVAAAGS